MGFMRSAVKRLLKRERRPPSPMIQSWSIGIFAGPSPYDLSDAPGVKNPVLSREQVSDVPAVFLADPFMVEVGGVWFMFVEVMNGRTRKGEVGLAVSQDALSWRYERIVLNEPFHLSYPYVFEWNGEHYMIPESWMAGAVRLYRARRFPEDWVYVDTLLRGDDLLDSSIVYANGQWWMFTETGRAPRGDTLRLYYATALQGPWREHPSSPIVAGDSHVSRPAGRIVVDGERIIRFAQDCDPKYGLAVHAFEVMTLTEHAYWERRVGAEPVLGAAGSGWNAGGMHHVDAHRLGSDRWIACVDGWVEVSWDSLGIVSP